MEKTHESGMCRDVRDFNEKFEVPRQGCYTNNWQLSPAEQEFRNKFLIEELNEYLSAVGCSLTTESANVAGKIKDPSYLQDSAKALDSLVDLVYVAIGTAYMHGFDFDAAWKLVQDANMQKIKVGSSLDSASSTGRGNKFDVKKPAGWLPPDIESLLKQPIEKDPVDRT